MLEEKNKAMRSGPAAASVFLLDEEPRVRDGLKNLLQSMGWAISGEAGGSREALAHEGLSGSALVLLGLMLGDESGLDLIAPLRERGLAVLVCSMHEGSNMIRCAMNAGANGYVTKREAAGHLIDGINTILAGVTYLSPRTAAALGMNTFQLQEENR